MTENLIGAVAGMTFALCIGLLITLSKAHQAILRIEGRVNALMNQSGIDSHEMAAEEAKKLARAGKKIEAIKAYRDLTGCGLSEAKMKVEEMM